MSKLQETFQQAVAAAQRKDNATARALLKQVLSEDPRHRDAWLLAAHVVETRREAIGCLRRALQIDPNHAYARQMLERLETEERAGGAAPPSVPSWAARPAPLEPTPAPARPPRAVEPEFRSAPPPVSTPGPSAPPGRRGNSSLMIGAAIGIVLICAGMLAIVALAGNSLSSVFGGGPTPAPEVAYAVVIENIRATNAENITAYMATIHPRSRGYSVTEQTLPEVWNEYDLSVQVSDLRIVESKPNEVRVGFTLTTRRIRGPAFRDNIVTGVFILRRDGDEWKIYNQEVENIQYLN